MGRADGAADKEDPMRVLMKITIPIEGGNKAVRDGSIGKVIGDTIERVRPEAAYFGLEGGQRTAFFVFDLKDASQLPAIVEPCFHGLNAGVEITPVMNPQDLKTGLEAWQKQTG
jgi:hypothetical protein